MAPPILGNVNAIRCSSVDHRLFTKENIIDLMNANTIWLGDRAVAGVMTAKERKRALSNELERKLNIQKRRQKPVEVVKEETQPVRKAPVPIQVSQGDWMPQIEEQQQVAPQYNLAQRLQARPVPQQPPVMRPSPDEQAVKLLIEMM